MDQNSASEDVTIGTMGRPDHHNETRGLLSLPSATTNIGVEEYEDMDQFSASENVTIGTMSGWAHHSETRVLPPPPPIFMTENADSQYEDLNQYHASEGVTMTENPCYETKNT